MSDFYEVLIAELRDDPLGVGYASMTDEQVAASLSEANRRVPTQRFISMRAIADVLDDVEYAKVKAAIQALASQSPRVADMLMFLNMPCDDSGTTGGLDFGNESVRMMIQSLPAVDSTITQATVDKLLALGEKVVSRAEELGLGEVNQYHVASARQLMNQ